MPVNWKSERQYQDIMYQTYKGIAKISINRPQVHNAFTPKTVMELIDAFSYARDDANIGVIILTGEGEKAFCSGGDQKVRGHGGYVGEDEIPRLKCIRFTAFNSFYSKTSCCNGCWLRNWRWSRTSSNL